MTNATDTAAAPANSTERRSHVRCAAVSDTAERRIAGHGLVDWKGRRSGTRIVIVEMTASWGEQWIDHAPARAGFRGHVIPARTFTGIDGYEIAMLDAHPGTLAGWKSARPGANLVPWLLGAVADLRAGRRPRWFEASVHATRDGKTFGAIPRSGCARFATREEAEAWGAKKAAAAAKRNRRNPRFTEG